LEQLGNIAGDVSNPTRNIPYGFCLAVCLITLNYVVPLTFTIAMAPDIDAWGTGYFVGIAKGTSPWLGVFAAVCGVFSSINNLIPQLTMASSATKATVRAGMFPPCLAFLGRDSALTGTPVAAILLTAGCSLCLLRLEFDVLVVMEVLCALVGLLLQFAAFLVLKHRQPNAPRPFAVPGGLCGAYLVSLPFFLLAFTLIFFDCVGNFIAPLVGGMCLFFLLIGKFWYADSVYTPNVLEALLRDEDELNAGPQKARATGQRPLPLETTSLLSEGGGL
jgi:amino acid transporter